MLLGAAASGIFSQSTGVKPSHANSTPNLSQSAGDNMKSSSALHNESNAETVHILEHNNPMEGYSRTDNSYNQNQVVQTMQRGVFHAFAVAFALSVHSIFEGLAFGLQDSVNDVS